MREEEGMAVELSLTVLPGKVDGKSLESLRDWLRLAVSDWQDSDGGWRQVTADSLDGAKDALARARKVQKALEDERKRVKKEVLKPYEDFESAYRLAVSELDGMIGSLSSQVGSFEDARKASLGEQVMGMIHDEAANMAGAEFASLVMDERCKAWFVDPQWLLKSYSPTRRQLAIRERLRDVERAITLINHEADGRDMLLDRYLSCGDYSAARQGWLESRRLMAKAEAPKGEAPGEDATPDFEDAGEATQSWTVTEPADLSDDDQRELKMTRVIYGKAWQLKAVLKLMQDMGMRAEKPSN